MSKSVDRHSAEALKSWALINALLASDATAMAGTYHNWSDEVLINSTDIFMEVFLGKIYEHNKDKLNQKQLEDMVKEAGVSFREIVELYTKVGILKAKKE